MILTDTHTHLYSEAFDEDRDEVIKNAMDLGVERFFIPAIDSTYTKAMFALEEAYPENMFLLIGLHPTHVKEKTSEKNCDMLKRCWVKENFMPLGKLVLICFGTRHS